MNFPKTRCLFACAAVLLSQSGVADDAEIEREQLRLILVQLNNVQALADRSETSRANTTARYHFDYPLFAQDIEAVRSGIEHYLTPGRAQPRPPRYRLRQNQFSLTCYWIEGISSFFSMR